ncbi:hypothetical protein LB505_003965 [Fusarium chuoi]|nr:hypothetical protein LB505_003965 [Fusarium chuoi]
MAQERAVYLVASVSSQESVAQSLLTRLLSIYMVMLSDQTLSVIFSLFHFRTLSNKSELLLMQPL